MTSQLKRSPWDTMQFTWQAIISHADQAEWDHQLGRFPGAQVFHLSGWLNVLIEAFEVTPTYFALRDATGRFRGLIAGYASAGMLAGRHWTSMDGGLLADGPEATDAVLAKCRQLAADRKVTYRLLRGGEQDETPALIHDTVWPYVPLTAHRSDMMASLGKKMRHQVRRALDLPFSIDISPQVPADFSPVFGRVQRDLGTPARGRALFDSINRHLTRHLTFIGLRQDGKLVGGMVTLKVDDALYSLYAATLPEYQRAYANYRLYWAALEHAGDMGCRRFEMGRSQPGSGTHRFKMKWRAQERWTAYAYYSCRGGPPRPPAAAGIRGKVWQHLPLCITDTVGPALRRTLPFG